MDIQLPVGCTTETYDVADDYIKHHYLSSLDVNKKEDGTYLIQAIFNVFNTQKQCEIVLDQNQAITKTICDCGFHHHQPYCHHVMAVVLYLNRVHIETYPYHFEEDKSQRLQELIISRQKAERHKELLELANASRSLIDEQKNVYDKMLLNSLVTQKIRLIPQIEIGGDEQISLSFKIGNDKEYILKDITTFIKDIDEQASRKYGKFLEFIHTENSFDDFSKRQIAFIRDVREKTIIMDRDWQGVFYYYRHYAKTMDIPFICLDNFFELYKDENTDIYFIDEDRGIHLTITEEDDFFKIEPPSFHYQASEHHLYDIDYLAKVIRRIQLDEDGKVIAFLNHFSNNQPLVVLKDQFNDFYKYVLLPLSDYIDFDIKAALSFRRYNQTSIYGDVLGENTVYFQIVYHDEDEHRAYGFSSKAITSYQQDIVESTIRQFASRIDDVNHYAIFDLDQEKTYDFLFNHLENLKQYATVYVSEALKNIGNKVSYGFNIGVKISHDLLAFDIESSHIPEGEIGHVLDAYKRKRKFYRLRSGEFVYLESQQLEELSAFLEKYHVNPKEIINGEFTMNKQKMLAIDEEDAFEFIELNRQDSFKQMVDHFKNTSQKDYPIVKKYDAILRDYQKDGYVWMATMKDYGFNGILADDMGLGKTLQVISLLEAQPKDTKSLVVCPASLIYNWEEEVHKFTDGLPVTCITGTQDQRHQLIQNMDEGLYVTSYDYMRRDVDYYENIEFDYVILDEAQYIKNQKTKNAQSVKTLKAQHRLALTGTPIENSLAELWSIFDFLMPQYLYSYHYFQSHYETDIVKNHNEQKTKQLRTLVSPFILRRNKKDVLTELPDKIEQDLLIPFSDEEERIYIANLAQVNEELQMMYNIEGSDKMQILAMLTRLRQLCLEPRMVYENIDTPSSKLKSCMDLLETFKNNHQKVLLFSSFTQVLDLIEEECIKNDISYYMLTGSTSKEMRKGLVNQFQNDDTTVFLISLKAGGTGLNLTAAEAVIHFDPWWNVSAQNQATDRAYRIGQQNKVQVYNLIMKNSIEEKIVQLQKSKKELADAFVENNSGAIASMSKDEILSLFSM